MLVDGRTVDQHAAIVLPDGQTLQIGRATTGLRCYVAVRGGVDVPPVSRQPFDGPAERARAAAVAGRTGALVGDAIAEPIPATDGLAFTDIAADPVIGVHPGPSSDWFGSEALQLLGSAAWTVDPASSRVGLRLTGPALKRSREGELAPEGMVTGSIQVPPNGRPVLLLNDHPTTGGYPVIAVARGADLHHAAQAAPGSVVRFRLLANPARPRTSP